MYPSKTKEYKQEYNRKNKEKIAKVTHEYYLSHKEDINRRRIESKVANPEKFILDRARASSKARGLEFDLEIEDILIPEYCPILGIKLKVVLGEGKKKYFREAASLDRIDSSKGYIKGNVWVISNLANMMKSDASIEQLITFSRSILRIFDE